MNLAFEKIYSRVEKQPSLKAVVVLTDRNPSDIEVLASERRKTERYYRLGLRELEPELHRLEITRKVRERTLKGTVLIDSSTDGSWVVFSDGRPSFVRMGVEYLMNKLYPDVSRLFLNYIQIQRLLELIRSEYSGQNVLTSITIKRVEKGATRSGQETLSLWGQKGEAELKRQLESYSVWVVRLQFEIRNDDGLTFLRGMITEDGVCKLRFGSFRDFYSKTVHTLVDLGREWNDFFSERDRAVVEGQVKLSPLKIVFPFVLGKGQLEALSEYISREYLSSVIQGGNPYFAASLSDYRSGASFGLTILGNTATITPVLGATPPTLWRLTNYLQNCIGEGSLLNVSAQELGDLGS